MSKGISKTVKSASTVEPANVARYFMFRAFQDGELVSPLKMQKLIYYAYVWVLVHNNTKLFKESIEAWPNGPVVPSLYHKLKTYGASPIDESFLEGISYDDLVKSFSPEVLETLSEVYEAYMTKTAFELVVMTHAERPWAEARKGLGTTEHSDAPITDESIVSYYVA